MTNVSLKPLEAEHIPLVSQWLQSKARHQDEVKQVFTQMKNKGDLACLHHWLDAKQDQRLCIILCDDHPVGYILLEQLQRVSDGMEVPGLLPASTMVIDLILESQSYLARGIEKTALALCLDRWVFPHYQYALTVLSSHELDQMRYFEQAGFTELKMEHDSVLMVICKKRVRLSTIEMIALERTFAQSWLPSDGLWVFGSRADLRKKGGDLDLYIQTHACTIDDIFTRKQQFLINLTNQIGEQKIDLVVNGLKFSDSLPIYRIAEKQGVKIL